MKTAKISLFTCALCCIAIVTRSPAQNIRITDGVRVVENTDILWNESSPRVIALVRKIGGRPANDFNSNLNHPFDVIQNKNGEILIVDSGNHRIQKFDHLGNFVRTIGSGGHSRGQFNAPIAIDQDRQGNIYVGSNNNRRIQVFSPSGRFIKQIKAEDNVSYFRVLSSNNYVMGERVKWSFFGGIDLQEENELVREYTKSGRQKRKFAKPHVYNVDSTTVADRGYTLAIDREDNTYLAFDYRNLIEKYDNEGKLTLQVTRPLNYATSTMQRDAEGTLGNLKPNRVSRSIDIDDKGRIWVLTFAKQTEQNQRYYVDQEVDIFEMHIFSAQGVYISKIPLKHFVDHFRIFGDRIFLVDTYKNMAVYEYVMEVK